MIDVSVTLVWTAKRHQPLEISGDSDVKSFTEWLTRLLTFTSTSSDEKLSVSDSPVGFKINKTDPRTNLRAVCRLVVSSLF